jgi:hypothetical protein
VKLIVAFRNFANAPKNETFNIHSHPHLVAKLIIYGIYDNSITLHRPVLL